MSRDPALYLEDILDACERVHEYVAGISYEELIADRMRFDAIVRNLELMGEAVRMLPQKVLDAMPELPWREIIGMRNILIHAYFGIDAEVVWSVATEELGPLYEAVQEYLERM